LWYNRAVAQGSSERQIAVVVRSQDTSSALRAAHMAFTLSETVASVALLGSRGHVGRALCQQIQTQRTKLAQDLKVGVSVNVAASSQTMVVCKDSRGLNLDSLGTSLEDENAQAFDLEKLTAVLQADINPLRVVVDCTNSEQVGDYYEKWLSMGVNIISPGRRVGAGNLDRYRRVCKAQRENSVNLYLDSSVGNALPIISTLHDLLETGDTIKSIEGSLSGTMAYVLSTFSDDLPFSEAVRGAMERDITERDFRLDLSGQDMAQKVAILAREAGLEVDIDDVKVESLLPAEITEQAFTSSDAMLQQVQESLDGPMLERLLVAKEAGRRLRYKFLIDVESGQCRCWLDSVENTDPLYRLKSNENLVAFATSRYETSPLIVKGASAGPDLSAAAIFADLIRVTRAYSSYQG
jgi:bifunctional aspartokinase / homoserine dehydrogenase 1